jgi:hypothetical protein
VDVWACHPGGFIDLSRHFAGDLRAHWGKQSEVSFGDIETRALAVAHQVIMHGAIGSPLSRSRWTAAFLAMNLAGKSGWPQEFSSSSDGVKKSLGMELSEAALAIENGMSLGVFGPGAKAKRHLSSFQGHADQ